MPCLRGSSSTKPITALDSSGLRRSSSATCWPPLPAPTISTSLSARCTSGWRSGRSTAARTRKRAPADQRQREQEVQRDHASRRVGVRGREQEQQADQHEARDHDGLDDRLEVGLVDEPPELRVEAERGEEHQLQRDDDDHRLGQQVLVAAGDPGVEPQHEREVVGERDQAGVDAHLSGAAEVHRRCDPGSHCFVAESSSFANSRGSRRMRSESCTGRFSICTWSGSSSFRRRPSRKQLLVDGAQTALESGEDGGAERHRLAVHGTAGGDHEVREGDQALRVDRVLGHDQAADRLYLRSLSGRPGQHDGLGGARQPLEHRAEQRVLEAVVERHLGRGAHDHDRLPPGRGPARRARRGRARSPPGSTPPSGPSYGRILPLAP